jgi:hypothetical protein
MKVYIEIEVPDNWAQRLDMQPHIEREIAADRWAWRPIPDLRTLRTLMRSAINAAEARMSPLADLQAMTLQAIDAEHLLWQGIQTAAATGVQPTRAPLTDQQVMDLVPNEQAGWSRGQYCQWMARAVERAHGIGTTGVRVDGPTLPKAEPCGPGGWCANCGVAHEGPHPAARGVPPSDGGKAE